MKKELSVIAGAIVLGAGLMVSVSASAGAPRVAFAIKPMAQAGTNSVKPMAQAGTNSVKPMAQAGTNSVKPMAQAGTNSVRPGAQAGTN